MLRLPNQLLLAALLSSSAAGALAMDADAPVGPFPEPPGAAASAPAPAPAKLPAVPPLSPEQLAENAALSAGVAGEEPLPPRVTLAEVKPRERPAAPLTADPAAASAQSAFDPAASVPSTVEEAPHRDFAALVLSGEIPEVSLASGGAAGDAVAPFQASVAFDERGDATRRGFAFAHFAAPDAGEVAFASASALAPAKTVAEAMAALESPVPEAEPAADGAPLSLAMADEESREPGRNVSPRRRPKWPANATAEGGPEVPMVFELRRK